MSQEIVRPFTPRQFPLADDVYEAMLRDVREDFDDTTPSPAPLEAAAAAASSTAIAAAAAATATATASVSALALDNTDTESSLSPLSPFAMDGDDPRDAEWDPSLEREKHKR
ncbi:hypothetical protein EVAR_21835_1 [Eumeta japonica]|uniref:Uncharacterized protein n=1 Tax=Eumeta variegata TaxID=151549 RepID=A0A4C1V7E4_EUMVA|nr:hypothetical protein EVAR_21835_1 [Eumeta japonica]